MPHLHHFGRELSAIFNRNVIGFRYECGSDCGAQFTPLLPPIGNFRALAVRLQQCVRAKLAKSDFRLIFERFVIG